MLNAPAMPNSASVHDGPPSRIIGIWTLALIIGVSLFASYLLVPDQSELVERLMKDQQYQRIREMLQSSVDDKDGINVRSLQDLEPEALASLSHLLRLTPKEQVQTIFSASRPLPYDRFVHAVTLSAIRYVDVITPEQAWLTIASQAGRIPPRYFAEIASMLSRNALAQSEPKLASTILARASSMPDATIATVRDMAQAFCWSGEPGKGALLMHGWIKQQAEGKLSVDELAELRQTGSRIAMEGGNPSLALDFELEALTARGDGGKISKGEMEKVMIFSTQSTRTQAVVPWLKRYVESLPEHQVPWRELEDFQSKQAASAAEYRRWTQLLAQYSDWSSQFDPAFDAHFRLAALGDTASMNRCLALADFLGRNEEMAELMQHSDLVSRRPELTVKLGSMLADLGREKEALQLFRRWTAAHPEDADAAHDLACLLEDSGDEAGALASFEQLIAKHPEHIPSIKKLAEARIRTGQYVEALHLYITLPEEAHDHNTLENYALLAESLDKHEELFKALTLRTRHNDLATVEPYLQIAETAAYLNTSRPAIKVMEEGLKRFPESPALRVALATVWLRDLNEIDACYAILRHPVVKQSFEGVSMLLEISSMVPDRNDLLSFLGTDIENQFTLSPQARLDLASLCHACGQAERGERLFASVPEDRGHLLLLAESRGEMNYLDEAIRLMLKHVTNNPKVSSDDWLFLGELYENTGRSDDAERAYEHSLGLLTSDLTDNRSAVNNEHPPPPDQ